MLVDRMIICRMVTTCLSFLTGEALLIILLFSNKLLPLLLVISLEMKAVPYSIVLSFRSMKDPSMDHSCCLVG